MNQGFSSAVGVEKKNEPTLEEARKPDLENGKRPIDDYFPSFNPDPRFQASLVPPHIKTAFKLL